MPTGLRAHSSGFLACLPPGCGARICSQALLGLPSPAWPAKPCLACCHNCHSQLRLASARLAAGQRVQRSSSECSAPPALLGLPGRTPPSFPARKAQRLPAHLQLLHSQSQPPLQRTRTPPSGSPPGSTTARAESSRGHLEVPRALGAAAWRKGGVGGASSRLPCSDPICLHRRAGWRRVGCHRTCIAPPHQPRLSPHCRTHLPLSRPTGSPAPLSPVKQYRLGVPPPAGLPCLPPTPQGRRQGPSRTCCARCQPGGCLAQACGQARTRAACPRGPSQPPARPALPLLAVSGMPCARLPQRFSPRRASEDDCC